MTVNDIAKAQAVREGKDNDLIYQETLKNQIIAFNSVLIKQSFEKDGFVNQSWIQTVKAVELTKLSASEHSFDLPEYVLRTTDKVPKPLPVKREPFIAVYNSVLSVNRRQLSYLMPEELPYVKYRRFTSGAVFYTWEDDYIYVHNNLLLEKISIRGIFDNPFTIPVFAKQQCKDCGESNEESTCFDNGDLVISEYNAGVIIASFLNGRANNAD